MSLFPSGLIYLVDDSLQVQAHLGELLRRYGYTVETYGSAEEFMIRSVDVSPAVIVLDMRLPGFCGLDLQNRLQALGRQTPIVFISGESQTQEVIAGFRGGAVDFLWKPFPIADLIAAIEKALAISRERERRDIQEHQLSIRIEQLTPREREVMRLMIDGYTNKAIGESLGVTADTVKKYRAQILDKLKVDGVPELIVMFRGSRLLEDLPPSVSVGDSGRP